MHDELTCDRSCSIQRCGWTVISQLRYQADALTDLAETQERLYSSSPTQVANGFMG